MRRKKNQSENFPRGGWGEGGGVRGLRCFFVRARGRGEAFAWGARARSPKGGGGRGGEGRRTRCRTLLPDDGVRPSVVRPRGARPPRAVLYVSFTASAPCRRRSESFAARTHTVVVVVRVVYAPPISVNFIIPISFFFPRCPFVYTVQTTTNTIVKRHIKYTIRVQCKKIYNPVSVLWLYILYIFLYFVVKLHNTRGGIIYAEF